jgi:hypothetical protein
MGISSVSVTAQEQQVSQGTRKEGVAILVEFGETK